MAEISVIVPSRNERFLQPTVADLLAKSRADTEVIVVLDGYWPNPPLPDDPRLKILHRGQSQGMRPAINSAVQMATGKYLLKCDAHTMWDEGYDAKLRADYHEDNWILTLRRYALDPEAWAIDRTNPKYPIDYHYLSNPKNTPGDSTPGLHGTAWTARREERKAILIDDEMSSQGSGWFMSRKHWDWLGPLETHNYGNFVHEFQELGLKTWLGGGAVKVTKNTWYAHLYKGARYGRGYSLGQSGHQQGTAFCTDFWMNDRWSRRVHSLRWLIEKFAPVPSWPTNLDLVFSAKREESVAFQITSAKYGTGLKEGEYVDVTQAVQALAGPTGLELPRVNNEALGVGSVFPGKRKRLWIEYSTDAGPKTASVIERKSLKLG